LTLQTKQVGTTVDFTNSSEIKMRKYLYPNDVFGIYAYQSSPATVNAATRNNFVNGNIADLQTQANTQGMPIQYMTITWNETQQGDNYYITDLVVGAISKVTGNINMQPAQLVTALNATAWFKQFISKINMPWKTWLLLTPTRTLAYNRWSEEMVSDWKSISKPMDQALPDPPSSEETLAKIRTEGQFDSALGQFSVQMLDKGYTVTLLGYDLAICYEKGQVIRQPGGYMWGYQYRLHVRFSWDFTSNPDITVEQSNRLFVWTVPIILAICAGIAAIAAVTILSYNLSHEESRYVKYGWVQNPETGEWEWKITEEGNDSGPPDWWSEVIQNLGTVALIIGGLVAAVVVIPRIIPKRKEEK